MCVKEIIVLIGIIFHFNLWAKGAKLRHPDPHPPEVLQQCKKRVNLARNHWVVRTNAPNLDQGLTGTCFAHSASTMMDIYRDLYVKNNTLVTVMDFKNEHKFSIKKTPLSFKSMKMVKRIGQSNPIWYAYLYYKYINAKDTTNFDGGEIMNTLKAGNLSGLCREDVMLNALKPFSIKQRLNVTDFYFITSHLMGRSKELKRELESREKNGWKSWKNIFPSNVLEKVPHFIENVNFRALFTALKPFMYPRTDYLGFFEKVFKKCQERKSKYQEIASISRAMKVCGRRPYRSSRTPWLIDFTNLIISILDKKLPVGFAYDPRVLTKDGLRYKNTDYKMRDAHASTIIGKRVRNNRCEFLVQNSWGNYCSKYIWECQKDKYGNDIGVWVNAYDLVQWTGEIAYFDISDKRNCMR